MATAQASSTSTHRSFKQTRWSRLEQKIHLFGGWGGAGLLGCSGDVLNGLTVTACWGSV